MKKLFLVLWSILLIWSVWAWYTWENDYNKIYTQEQDKVIDTENLDDPLHAWTKSAIQEVDWIANADVSSSENKKESMIDYISKWINYFLAFLWMIVIILIIKDGFIIITSAWDENKKKEAFTNLKNYAIAIVMIWVAFLIVNLIFYFVNVNTGNV